MRINDALEEFVLQLEANGRSPHTVAQYRRHVASLAAWLAPQDDVQRVDHQTLARFLTSPAVREKRGGGPRKATSANGLRSSLRVFGGWCHAAGYARRNAAALVQRARCSPPRPRGLSDDEQRRLLDVLAGAPERDRVLVLTLLRCGLRVGSAMALNVGDLDLERGELTVRAGKGGQGDRFPVGQALRADLQKLVAGRTEGPVFVGRLGRRMTTRHAARLFQALARRAGISRAVSPHSLRHTYAEAVLARTGSIFAVKEALGHRSIQSTLVYLEGRREAIRRAAVV